VTVTPSGKARVASNIQSMDTVTAQFIDDSSA